jgi:hypothetical protein
VPGAVPGGGDHAVNTHSHSAVKFGDDLVVVEKVADEPLITSKETADKDRNELIEGRPAAPRTLKC